MTIDPLADWWVHTIVVEPFLGRTGSGVNRYGPKQTLTGFVDDKRRLVRDSIGEQVVSETTIALPKTAPHLPAGTRVRLPGSFGGRLTTVIAASIGDTGGLLDIDHAQYALA